MNSDPNTARTFEVYIIDSPNGIRHIYRASGPADARQRTADDTGDRDVIDPAGGWSCHRLADDGEPGVILAGEWPGKNRA